MYDQIIIFFAHDSVYAPCEKPYYRCYTSDLTVTYIFASVGHFHKVFMYDRIQLCQNDAEA